MNFPSSPRYDYCVEKALEFIEDNNIDTYPIDLFKFIDESPYSLTPYSKIMSAFGTTIDVVCKKLKSPEGRTVYSDGIYSIAFNDVTCKKSRILFTLAHEIGHIYLNHMLDFNITAISKGTKEEEMTRSEYMILEREANVFARNILVPIPLYYFSQNKSYSSVQRMFGISLDAAIKREIFIEKDYKSSRTLGLYDRFMNIYNNYFYKRHCRACDYQFIQKKGDYCPICGSLNTLIWENGDKMKYLLLETHANGKLKKCPICSNDETGTSGDYCQICGTTIANRCSSQNCTNTDILPSNARYCPVCGGKSKFFCNNILTDYTDEFFDSFKVPETDQELPFHDEYL